MNRIDCVAYESPIRCAGLVTKKCDGCKFYKTKEQFYEENKRAMQICHEKGITQYDDYFRKILGRKDDENEQIENSEQQVPQS